MGGIKPTRWEYREILTELKASNLVVEESLCDRGAHVPVTHMGYFKLPVKAFLSEIKNKDL